MFSVAVVMKMKQAGKQQQEMADAKQGLKDLREVSVCVCVCRDP